MASQLWEVVGGSSTGGIVVREGCPLTSTRLNDRLCVGAVVEEVSLVGERLHFQKKAGKGPWTGWVSVQLKGKELLARVPKQDVGTTEDLASIDSASVLFLLRGGSIAARERDEAGNTLLHRAAVAPPGEDAATAISTLLAVRAELDCRNSLGETPLMLATRRAVEGGGLALVRMLLELRADANSAEALASETPLMDAAAGGAGAACELLLEHAADPERRNTAGLDAWALAKSAGHEQVAQLLVRASGRPEPTVTVWAVIPDIGESLPVEVPAVAATLGDARRASQHKLGLRKHFLVLEGGSRDFEPLGARRELTFGLSEVSPQDEEPCEAAGAKPQCGRGERASVALVELRAACSKAGLAVQWCAQPERLRAMLSAAEFWSGQPFDVLRHECEAKGVPVTGAAGPGDLCFRLRQAIVWENMDDEQLERACQHNGLVVPAMPYCFPSEMEREAACRRAHLVANLIQNAFGFPSTGVPRPANTSRPPSAPTAAQSSEKFGGHAQQGQREEPGHARQPPHKVPRAPPGKWGGTWTDEEASSAADGSAHPQRSSPRPLPAAAEASLQEEFRVLGLAAGATVDVVRKSYRKLALRHHPDKHPENENAAEEFKRIVSAYETVAKAFASHS